MPFRPLALHCTSDFNLTAGRSRRRSPHGEAGVAPDRAVLDGWTSGV